MNEHLENSSLECVAANQKVVVILTLTIAILLLFIVSFPTHGKITVDPMNLSFEAQAGENIVREITVKNTGTETTEVSLTLLDWWRSPEGSLQFFSPGSRDRSCAEWLLYSPSELTIPPQETKDITVEIQVPEEVLTEGTRWAMLIVQERGSAREQEGVTTRITINYIVKIFYHDPGYTEKSGKITKMAVEQKNPLSFSIRAENTSKSYLRSEGTLSIRNLQGETEGEIEIERFGILPGAKRNITVEWKGDLTLNQGQYYAIAVMDFGGESLVQGGLPLEILGEDQAGNTNSSTK